MVTKDRLYDELLEHLYRGCIDSRCDFENVEKFTEHLVEAVMEVLEEDS